jgi:hypothetical protein
VNTKGEKDMNKIDWSKETDPRKYCFGHVLYRRLVSTVTSYRLRIAEDVEKLEEVDKTMSLLGDSCFTSRGGHVEVFEFALNQEVLVRQEDGYKEHVRCKVIGQLMMNVESEDCPDGVCECYLTDKHGTVWQAPEMMTAIMEEKDDTVKDVSDETHTS